MPSELELKMLDRLDQLETEVAALKRKLAAKPVEAARRVPEKKAEEVKRDVR